MLSLCLVDPSTNAPVSHWLDLKTARVCVPAGVMAGGRTHGNPFGATQRGMAERGVAGCGGWSVWRGVVWCRMAWRGGACRGVD